MLECDSYAQILPAGRNSHRFKHEAFVQRVNNLRTDRMANDDILRQRINSALTGFVGVSGDAYDMVRGCGLPTFIEFEEAIAPLLKRVTPNERRTLLEGLYVVTARKFMKEAGRRGMEYMMADDLRKRRMLLSRTRARIKNARESVSAAEATFPRLLPTSFDFKEIIKRLTEFETDLTEREQGLAALVHPRFKTKTEKQIRPPEHSAAPLPWTSDDSIEQWFIKALDKCLPAPRTSTRSRFSRNKVIQQILKASGDNVSIRTIIRARKLKNTTPKGDKKT
jgi:hypothetical protein